MIHAVLTTLIFISGSNLAFAAAPIGCAEIPARCGIVSKAKSRGCPTQWQAHSGVNTAAACAVVMKNDPKYSDYSICSNLYRQMDQFADLHFSRQFGSEVLSKGSCRPPTNYPSCTQIGAIEQGGFCQCPAGSKNRLATCTPNGSDTVCMSTSIGAEQCQ